MIANLWLKIQIFIENITKVCIKLHQILEWNNSSGMHLERCWFLLLHDEIRFLILLHCDWCYDCQWYLEVDQTKQFVICAYLGIKMKWFQIISLQLNFSTFSAWQSFNYLDSQLNFKRIFFFGYFLANFEFWHAFSTLLLYYYLKKKPKTCKVGDRIK